MNKYLNNLIDFVIMNDLFNCNTVDVFNLWIKEDDIKIKSHNDLVLILNYIDLIKTTDKDLLMRSAITLSVT